MHHTAAAPNHTAAGHRMVNPRPLRANHIAHLTALLPQPVIRSHATAAAHTAHPPANTAMRHRLHTAVISTVSTANHSTAAADTSNSTVVGVVDMEDSSNRHMAEAAVADIRGTVSSHHRIMVATASHSIIVIIIIRVVAATLGNTVKNLGTKVDDNSVRMRSGVLSKLVHDVEGMGQ